MQAPFCDAAVAENCRVAARERDIVTWTTLNVGLPWPLGMFLACYTSGKRGNIG
jgi:hypothetical protein